MNYLEKLIAVITAILLIFLIPSSYFIMKREHIIQINVTNLTENLSNRAAVQGYITRDMYEDYLTELSLTGKLYDIELIHERITFEPEYRLRTSDEIIEENEDAWVGINEYHEEPVNTDLPVISDPITAGSLNTETNESVMASAVALPASPYHIHTSECYIGHTHTDGSGITSSVTAHGCYTIPVYNSIQCSGTYAYSYSTVSYSSMSCSGCGKGVMASSTTAWYQCGTCRSGYSGLSGPWTYTCSNCGISVSTGGSGGGSLAGLRCSNSSSIVTSFRCDMTEDTTLDCSGMVIGISPTHPVQTVAKDDPLITTAIISYRDGSSETKACTTTFSTANVARSITATLTYVYNAGGSTFVKNGSVLVSVVPRSKTCVNGHVFNLNSDGTDPGCPYCRGWLKSLSVCVPSDGRLKIYRSPTNTLEKEGVGLLAEYLDGHNEYVYTGYVDNLDPDYVGVQTVTIGYKGFTTNLTVTVLRNKKKCEVCGFDYELQPDNQDMGCPLCKAKVPVFTGNVMKYQAKSYENEIITELYEGCGIYYFRRGDTISVNVNSIEELGINSFITGLIRLKIRADSSDTVWD